MGRCIKKKEKTCVAIVLDRSGSMSSIHREAVQSFNTQLATIQQEAGKHGQETLVTYISFASDVALEFCHTDVNFLKPMQEHSFKTDGYTSLFDAVGLAIRQLERVVDADAFLVLVITDGGENNSRQYGVQGHRGFSLGMTRINELIDDKVRSGNWTFGFQMPADQVAAFVRDFKIEKDNIRAWENTAVGTQCMTQSNVAGLQSYFTARSAGKKKVEKFYADVDLSQVTTKDVKQTLDDISDQFKLYTVEREVAVKEFVEQKTKKPYVIGSTFYQLYKPEKVAPTKSVLIMEKGKKAVWGGQEARDLIGLPPDKDAKVTPKNLAAYEIYVESRSVNRILSRGTKVLVNLAAKKDAIPTWDHTAVP